jgi:hypothetical protein
MALQQPDQIELEQESDDLMHDDQDEQQQGVPQAAEHSRSVVDPPALRDTYAAIDHLTRRCVGSSRSGGAVADMRVRPALHALQQQLAAALHGVVRDGASLSVLVQGDPGSGKTLVSCSK